jgi:hypothetical protein
MVLHILAWFTLIVYGLCLLYCLLTNAQMKNRVTVIFLMSVIVTQSALTLFGG